MCVNSILLFYDHVNPPKSLGGKRPVYFRIAILSHVSEKRFRHRRERLHRKFHCPSFKSQQLAVAEQPQKTDVILLANSIQNRKGDRRRSQVITHLGTSTPRPTELFYQSHLVLRPERWVRSRKPEVFYFRVMPLFWLRAKDHTTSQGV